MRIALATSVWRTDLAEAGAARLNSLVKGLERNGVQPIFVSGRKSQRIPSYPIRLGKEVFRARRSSPDLVYMFVHNPTISLVSDLVKLGTEKRVICHIASPSLEDVRSLRGTSLSWRTLYQISFNNSLWFRFYPKLSDAFIVNTLFQKKQLVKLKVSEEKIHILPSFIDRSVFYPREKKYSIADLKLDPRYKYCVYIGHFTPVKGVEDLIVAFSCLVNEFPDVKLILAWSGYGSKKRLEKLIHMHSMEERIIWMGKVDVSKLLSASEIIILPYRHYVGTTYPPNLILEALCVGAPIVSTNVGCVPEFVKNGETGILAAPKSPESLKSAMLCLLSDDRLRKSISDTQISISGNFDQDRNVKPYIKLFHRMVNSEAR